MSNYGVGLVTRVLFVEGARDEEERVETSSFATVLEEPVANGAMPALLLLKHASLYPTPPHAIEIQ